MNFIYNNKILGTISPLLKYIIITILYFLLFIYFADIFYCDNISLDELKVDLGIELDRYYKALYDYKEADDLLHQAKNRPERFSEIIQYLTNKTKYKRIVMNTCINNVYSKLAVIHYMEPSWELPVIYHYIGRI